MPAFDIRVEQHHKVQFNSNFQLTTRYLGSKLRPYVTEMSCAGESATAADLIGNVTAVRQPGRARSNYENPPGRARRWLLYRDPVTTGQYLDRVDKFRMIETPDSELLQAHANAIQTFLDRVILGIDELGAVSEGGILGSAWEGKLAPQTPVALAAPNVTAHGGTGLTIAKLRAARKQLGLSENDLERQTPVMAISTAQHDNLLGIVEGASANLNMLEQPQLVDGRVKRLMGFQFVETNLLPLAAGSPNVRSCPVWLKDKVKLGIWQDITTDMWNDTHADNLPYMKVSFVMDAVRIEETGVHNILCAET